MEEVRLRIKRQPSPREDSYWEDFVVPFRPKMNIVAALMEIRRHPVNARGERTTPVVWEASCLEEVCGSCTMLINGRVRQACSALVEKLRQPIRLEPLTAFPVIRDLMVDRQVLFDNLQKVHAWITVDGTHDLGPGPALSPEVQGWAYELSRCMTCGACAEACPNFGPESTFVGAYALNQVRLLNAHPNGRFEAGVRLDAIMGEGGIEQCGNSQNCVRVCPKGIPLTTSIAALNRDTLRHGVRRALEG